jgi:putative selenium metabolism protein SsnA
VSRERYVSRVAILLTDALLCDLDPPRVERGSLRIDGGQIVERGGKLSARAGDEVIDCGWAVTLPGLVNGHTHLYSALAVGMPPPSKAPNSFLEILQYVWWRLDQALDAETIEMSARIGALLALRCGTTTLIDHHASPRCIEGSLDLLECGIVSVGLRGVLCYETTDRHGREGREAGLAENRRYIKKCHGRGDGRFAGLVGAHASFTLEDESLEALAALSRETGCGVHIHVAEDPCDEADCRQRCGVSLIDRLDRHGLLTSDAVFAHGTHLDARAVGRVREAEVMMAHNPRSNMNNAVGYAPVASFGDRSMLGTDGIGGDLFAEAKAAWYIARHEKAGLSPANVLGMLARSARRASRSFGVTLGRLSVGAAADVVLTNYRPYTELTTENLAGHLLWGLSAGCVRDVLVEGAWRLRAGRVVSCNMADLHAQSVDVARRLWARLSSM